MKKIIALIGTMVVSSVLWAQSALPGKYDGSAVMPEMLVEKIVKVKTAKSTLQKSVVGEWKITIDHLFDFSTSKYDLIVVPLNANLGCDSFKFYYSGDVGNPDSVGWLSFMNFSFVEWNITKLVNGDTVFPYDLTTACVSYHIDTIYVLFTYYNPTQVADTLYLTVKQGNNVLWGDTIYNVFSAISASPNSDPLKPAYGMSIPVNLSLDTPPGIITFRMEYFANKDSATMVLLTAFHKTNSCNNNCGASLADLHAPGNFRVNFSLPRFSFCNVTHTNNTSNMGLYLDCNQSGSFEEAECEILSPMPLIWAVGRFRTTNYPASLDADIQTADNTRLVCAGQDITVEATSGFDSYTWSGVGASGTTNTGTINIPPASVTSNPDTFVVTVTGQGAAIGCSASDQLTVVAYNAPPIANFVLNTTSGDPTVTVDNTSLYAVNCIWDWGDGNLTTSCEHFAYTYASFGEYSITLIVSNPCGSDTIQRNAVLTSNPLVSTATLTYMHRNNTVIVEGLPAEATHIMFADVMGRVIRTVAIEGKETVEVDVSDMPSQLYNVIIMGDEGRLGVFKFRR